MKVSLGSQVKVMDFEAAVAALGLAARPWTGGAPTVTLVTGVGIPTLQEARATPFACATLAGGPHPLQGLRLGALAALGVMVGGADASCEAIADFITEWTGRRNMAGALALAMAANAKLDGEVAAAAVATTGTPAAAVAAPSSTLLVDLAAAASRVCGAVATALDAVYQSDLVNRVLDKVATLAPLGFTGAGV